MHQYTNSKGAQAPPLACTVKNVIGLLSSEEHWTWILGNSCHKYELISVIRNEGKPGYFCRYKDLEYASVYSAASWLLVFRRVSEMLKKPTRETPHSPASEYKNDSCRSDRQMHTASTSYSVSERGGHSCSSCLGHKKPGYQLLRRDGHWWDSAKWRGKPAENKT